MGLSKIDVRENMKKIGLIMLLFLFILVGCAPKGTDKTEAKENLYKLGQYGDYIKYVDETKDPSTLEEVYSSLLEKDKGSVNGVFQTNYTVGLLKFFSIDEKIKLTIDMKEEEVRKLDEDFETGNKESYRICNLEIQMGELLFHYEQVGIRQKGNSSRGAILDEEGNLNLRHYKLSFSETFDDEFTNNPIQWEDDEAYEFRENRNFFGIEKLNIRWNRNQESTYLREYYAFEMYRANGVLAPRSNPVQVEMKREGEIQNLGIYLAVEDIDKSFIKRNLVKDAAGGDLYKMGWTNVGARLDSLDASLFGVEYQIKDQQKFKQIGYPYDLKTNKKTSKHEAIKAFIEKIIRTKTSDFDEFMKEDMLYEYTMNYFAVSYLLGDPDDLRGNSNNTYLYFLKNTNQALFIPTDHDRALGSTGGGGNPTNHHGALNQPFDDKTGYEVNTTPFFTKSLLEGGNLQIKKDYLQAIDQIISKKWLDLSTFESYYNQVKKHYSSSLELGNRVNGKKIDFSLKEVDNPSDSWNLSIEVYFEKKKATFLSFSWNPEEELDYSIYYLRGEMNGWNGITKEFNLKFENGIPTLLIHLETSQAFKVADARWESEFNYNDLENKDLFNSVGDNKNISVKESGFYKIEIINYETKDQKLLITKQ